MRDIQRIVEEPTHTEKHYELLTPFILGDSLSKIRSLGIHIVQRLGEKVLENPISPKPIDAEGWVFLVYCTPEQANKALSLPFVLNIELHKPSYPREKILSALKLNVELTIQFFCTFSSVLEQRLKKYMANPQSKFKKDTGIEKFGLFSIPINKPEEIHIIDEIAKMDEVQSVEFSGPRTLLS
ncbi:hypothetical protein [Legionella gresilensis]|uniref:hypothetical protein n=1 Tax=Legionella gresilensis TaxID=91823 RepID=UPI0010416F1F|nr:hypothetical protein [Legionella gresilensis]